MNMSRYLVALIAALAGMVLAIPVSVAAPPRYDGLVAVQSRTLDKLYIRPDAEMARYQKVMIDPVTVEFSKEWDKSSTTRAT
jgi:Protein of unknown function (DUF3313).